MTPTIQPQPKQHQAYKVLQDDETRFLLFGGGAGGGKSWLGCEWLITNCYFYPGSKWFIGRNELTRLMKSSYITFGKVCKYHGIPRDDWNLDGKWNVIKFANGSSIDLLDLAPQPRDEDYERFGSLEYTGGWIEEAGEVAFKAFDVLKSRVGRHENERYSIKIPKILLTCNPNKEWLYRLIYKPDKEGTLPTEYKFIKALYSDNKYTAEDYGEQLSSIDDKATQQRLKYGNWEYDDDPASLINFEAILDLFTNTVDEGKIYMSVDVARFGKDKTVVGIWEGLELIHIHMYERQGLDVTKDKIRTLASNHRIPYSHIVIDEDGVGGGLVDQLSGVRGFVNNSSPLEEDGERPNFANLKAQCSYKMAYLVNNRLMSVKIEDETIKDMIVEELEQIRAKDIDKDGKLKVRPKEEVKEILGRSPDVSDMIMMRTVFEIKQPIKRRSTHYRPKHATHVSRL